MAIIIIFFFYSKEDEVPIYTCSSSVHKPITWNEFIDMNARHGYYWPTIRAIWYSSFWVTGNPYLYAILNLFCHIIPGYLLDTLAVVAGQKPMWVTNNEPDKKKKKRCSRVSVVQGFHEKKNPDRRIVMSLF